MLSLSCKIQNKKGGYDRALVIDHKYSPKYKHEFITYTNIDDPGSNYVVPVIKEDSTYYVDYSFSKDMLLALYKSFTVPAFGELPEVIDLYKKNNIIKFQETRYDIPKVKEDEGKAPSVSKQKVVTFEDIKVKKPVKVEEMKDIILFVRLNDNLHMIFKVKENKDSYYMCERIKDKDLEQEKNAEVIETTFSIPNYYKLEGESNISRANHMYTKILKKLIIRDTESLHVLIAKYLDKCYAYFVIKNETKDVYEIEPTTYDYIKNHPYDLVIKTISNDDEYREFLEKYKDAYRNNTTMKMAKRVRQEEKLSVQDTQLIDITEEDDKIKEYENEETIRKAA